MRTALARIILCRPPELLHGLVRDLRALGCSIAGSLMNISRRRGELDFRLSYQDEHKVRH